MPDEKDHLSNSVALSLGIDRENWSISASVTSRFIAAIDRMFGALVDVRAADFEMKAEAIRNANLSHQSVSGSPSSPDPLSLEPNIEAVLRERELRKTANKRHVIEKTAEQLSEDDVGPETDEQLDGDWLNVFEMHSENASSERVRDHWAQVLAGEIKKPGTYSLSSLRFLAEVDAHIAGVFADVMGSRLSELMLLGRERKGPDLMQVLELEEAGLVQNATTTLTQGFEVKDDGFAIFIGEDYLIRMQPREKNAKTVGIPFIKISRIGRELCNLVPRKSERAIMYDLASFLIDEKHAEQVDLARIVERPEGYVRWEIDTSLPEKPNN